MNEFMSVGFNYPISDSHLRNAGKCPTICLKTMNKVNQDNERPFALHAW